eukprot:TRINITY_DN94713_c0_g1_i1.p1 TRINITY_DN94713_c0_g1~~TRINITY_DN94713_c0_g1_i1.p1  ORF type:complete len:232 (-),score=49.23 TRINITY_DN94713_c0_g1_i1:6-701(-)
MSFLSCGCCNEERDPQKESSIIVHSATAHLDKQVEEENEAERLAREQAATLPIPAKDAAEEDEIAFSWKANISKTDGQALGMSLDYTEGTLPIVIKVDEAGLMGKWNATCNAVERVEQGVALKQVNLATGMAMLDLIKGSGDFEITFVRPIDKVVSLRKAGAPLGVKLALSEANKCVVVKSVQPQGLAQQNGIRVGDLIYEVNGHQDHPQNLCTMIVEEDKLTLKLRSCYK